MTTRPHDALFKAAFESTANIAGLCREVLPAEIANAIAWETTTRETGSFIDPELADFHSDLLFRVELAGQPAYLYMLVEHQSSIDEHMPLRMLHYVVRIWMRHIGDAGLPLPPVLPVLVTHTPGGWTAARRVHQLVAPAPDQIPGLAALVPDMSLVVDDLTAHEDEALRNRALAAFPKLALWLLKQGRDGAELLAGFEAWAEVLNEVLRAPSGATGLAHTLRYVALVAGDLHFADFHAKLVKVLPKSEETLMTIAEELRREGHLEGRKEGRKEGRARTLREVLLNQLTLKFGEAASVAHAARVENAEVEDLLTYTERIVVAESLDEIFA